MAIDVSPQIARRAVEWLVALQSGDVSREALQDWLTQHPDHARAWQRIESVNNKLRGVASPLTTALAHATLTAPRSNKRRAAIKTLAAFFFVGATAYMAEEHLPWRAWSADERTALGERRTIVLVDGTELTLNTDSAVNIRYTELERRVFVVSGEIMVTTASDGAAMPRPFVVQTAQGELRPLGTRFAVRQKSEFSRLDVFEGAVEVRPKDGAGLVRVIQAGERVQFTHDGIAEPVSLKPDDAAWAEGMIVASGMRLHDFLAELSRYRRGRLSCDPAIAGLRVSGTYPLNDTDLVLTALRSTLPVEIHYLTRYWVTIRPGKMS
ncbi:histidine kinase [Herminiimonas sp. KBW02]|nr:histidine kinase [Herminiimonas sp. KBW02]